MVCVIFSLLDKIENDLGPPCKFFFLITNLGKKLNLKILPSILKYSYGENVCKISKKSIKFYETWFNFSDKRP